MSAQNNVALEERLKETVWDRHDAEAAGDFVDVNVVEHDSILGPGLGLEGYMRSLRLAFSAFLDLELIQEDLIADADKIADQSPGTTACDF